MEGDSKSLIKSIKILDIEGFFPNPRSYFIIQKVDQDQILFHGGCDSKKEYKQIDIFDLINLKWNSINDISSVNAFLIFDKPLSGHTSNVDNSKIIVYGGYDGYSYSNAIYYIETDDYTFQQIDVRGNEGSEYPTARCYHTSNYVQSDDCLYVYGGWNANLSPENLKNFTYLWKFNFKCKIIFNL
jgi:hypothetical protein